MIIYAMVCKKKKEFYVDVQLWVLCFVKSIS